MNTLPALFTYRLNVEMEQCLQNLKHQPVSFAKMDQALVMIWNDIPQALLNILLGLMRCLCQAYINANGGHTVKKLSFFLMVISSEDKTVLDRLCRLLMQGVNSLVLNGQRVVSLS